MSKRETHRALQVWKVLVANALFIYLKRTFSENKSNGKGLDPQLIKEVVFR
jgi:hypothetical protein